MWDDEPGSFELLLGRGPLPDLERVEKALDLLTRLREVAAPTRQLPLLCMLAWLSWAVGRGTRASQYLEAAASIDAGYSMAALLWSMFSAGMFPEWLTDRA